MSEELAKKIAELRGYVPIKFDGQDPKSLWNDHWLYSSLIESGFTHSLDGKAARIPPLDAALAFELLEEMHAANLSRLDGGQWYCKAAMHSTPHVARTPAESIGHAWVEWKGSGK